MVTGLPEILLKFRGRDTTILLLRKKSVENIVINVMLLNNIKEVYKRISQAAMRAGRSPEEVKLVAVTKGAGVEAVVESIDIGLRDFGESRIQAAQEKIPLVKSRAQDSAVVWHLIGHLQKNKAKAAVELFDIIHSVDSPRLAEVLDKHAERIGKKQKILLQVKLSDDKSKYGILKENIIGSIKDIQRMKSLKIRGLMTIPPFFEDAEMARPYFRELRKIKEEAESSGFRLPELSMGMSNDFEVAIEEGATMVRIGTAIFGERKRGAK